MGSVSPKSSEHCSAWAACAASVGGGFVPILTGALPVAPGLVAIPRGVGSILGGLVTVPGGLGSVDGGLVTVGGGPGPCQRRSGLLDHGGGLLHRFLRPQPGQPGEILGGMKPVLRRRDPMAAGRSTVGSRPGEHFPQPRPTASERLGLAVPCPSFLIAGRRRGIARLRRRHPLRQLAVAHPRQPGMLLGLALAPVGVSVTVGRGLVALLSQPITVLGPTIAPLGGPVAVGGPVIPAGGQFVATGRDLIAQPGRLHPRPRRVVGRS
jgi:hypothetical protein